MTTDTEKTLDDRAILDEKILASKYFRDEKGQMTICAIDALFSLMDDLHQALKQAESENAFYCAAFTKLGATIKEQHERFNRE